MKLSELILHDDNAQPHRACMTTKLLVKDWIESYPNASYSSDPSPCDYFLFSKLKHQLRAIHLNNDDEMLDVLDHVI